MAWIFMNIIILIVYSDNIFLSLVGDVEASDGWKKKGGASTGRLKPCGCYESVQPIKLG